MCMLLVTKHTVMLSRVCLKQYRERKIHKSDVAIVMILQLCL